MLKNLIAKCTKLLGHWNFTNLDLFRISKLGFRISRIRLAGCILSFGFVAIALVERLFLDLGPNVELITVASLLATYYLGARYGVLVVLTSLAISDYFLGLTTISIFTWSAFLVIAFGGKLLRKLKTERLKTDPRRRKTEIRLRSSVFENLFSAFRHLPSPFTAGIYSIGGALLFYLWTNFGVWLISGMYPPTLSGLLQSYYMALPFLKWQLVSNMVIVPMGFVLAETILALSAKLKPSWPVRTDTTIVGLFRKT